MTRHGNETRATAPSAGTRRRARSSSCSSSSSSNSTCSSSGSSSASFRLSMKVEPLDVASVTVPKDAMEKRGEITFFAVHIMPRSGVEPWVVMRRYNDFFALQRELGANAHAFADAPFPQKKPFGCSGQKLEDRRCGLEAWLRRSIEHAHNKEAWWSSLHEFLEDRRCIQAMPIQQHGAAAIDHIPSAPPPSQESNVVPSAMQALHGNPKDACV